MFLSRKKTLNMGRLSRVKFKMLKKPTVGTKLFIFLLFLFFFFYLILIFLLPNITPKKKKKPSQAHKAHSHRPARITEENTTEHQRERQPHWSRVYSFFFYWFFTHIYIYIYFSPERNKQDPRKEDRSSILLPVVNKARETPESFLLLPFRLFLSLIRVFGFCFLFF